MNDFQGLLSGDYGFKPQGKSAPMAPPRSNSSTSNSAFDFDLDDQTNLFPRSRSSATNRNYSDFDNDVFGGSSRLSSLPVFDKPVYDDEHDAFDDILGGLGRKEPESKDLGGSGRNIGKDIPDFDDLLPGFGASTAPNNRNPLDSRWDKKPTGRGSEKAAMDMEDPFVALKSSPSGGPSTRALYDDPLEQSSTFADSNSNKSENVFSSGGIFEDMNPFGGSSSKKSENISASGGLFDDVDPLVGLGNSAPMNDKEKAGSPDRSGTTVSSGQISASAEARDMSSSVDFLQRNSEKKMSAEEYRESPSFDTYSASVDSHRSAPNIFSSSYVNASDDITSQRHTSTAYDNNLDSSDDVWLTVSEIPLFTQPTVAPPPSRPPPPKPPRISKAGAGSNAPSYPKKKINDHSSFPTSAQFSPNPESVLAGGKSSFASPVDGHSDVLSGDGLARHSDAAASAAAMKEAVDMAEARFKHAKEARERGTAKSARMQQQVREDKKISDFQEREFSERQDAEGHLREEEERKQREEEERICREMEEKERKQRRIERERVERERVRQAVERATREARDRAAAEALVRAEKVAVGKAQAEARERAVRVAVFKAQEEARQRAARAAVEAKQRADREKAEREAREKSERAEKEKEARDKAAAAAASANQQRNENDLESFFGMGSASNAPRPRDNSSNPFSDTQFPKKQSGSVRTSVGSTASMRKTSSSTNIVDDLNSILGGTPSAGEFREFEGETEERRNARLQRHQRTQERAAKALAEKNQRDVEAQNEQAERHRIGETLDVEIKRWSAGKEGNLRALLSTLQYVLWSECGWQPVSLTDLITGASVKKVYRKATLCIHPDKVQQKGATLQQKYVAEKVFDLLKEAWNKFNSEELF